MSSPPQLPLAKSNSSGDNTIAGEGSKRVLSIQSHVVSGYVGNKAAVFPLQLLGFDVDVINSVQFSNHTGYPFGWEGEVLDGSMLGKLVDGMDANGLLSGDRVGNILTGYIGSESFLRAVVAVVNKLKASNPRCRYVCDPVLGDMGRFYVPKELVEIYRRDVLPLADVITPNQFETERLTGISIECVGDAQRACRVLHDAGVSVVLITSIAFRDDGKRGVDDDDCDAASTTVSGSTPPSKDSIGMFASRRSSHRQSRDTNRSSTGEQPQADAECSDEQYILYTPRLAGQFTGTGDVCAALFLGWTSDDESIEEDGDSPLACALEKLAGTMQAIVQRTAASAVAEVRAEASSTSTSTERAKGVSSRELKLVQSREDILHPPRKYRASRVRSDVPL